MSFGSSVNFENATETKEATRTPQALSNKLTASGCSPSGPQSDRIYVLVTSYSPLTIYLHRCGFARFSARRYSSSLNEMGNSFIHLTNVAIRKSGESYNSETGGKWGIRELKLYLLSRHGAAAVDELFQKIQMVRPETW